MDKILMLFSVQIKQKLNHIFIFFHNLKVVINAHFPQNLTYWRAILNGNIFQTIRNCVYLARNKPNIIKFVVIFFNIEVYKVLYARWSFFFRGLITHKKFIYLFAIQSVNSHFTSFFLISHVTLKSWNYLRIVFILLVNIIYLACKLHFNVQTFFYIKNKLHLALFKEKNVLPIFAFSCCSTWSMYKRINVSAA